MVFHFAQAKQKWKNYRDQVRLTFLAPLHQIALLFTASACDSKVSLLAGYMYAYVILTVEEDHV